MITRGRELPTVRLDGAIFGGPGTGRQAEPSWKSVVGRRLTLPVESTPEETFGPFGSIFALDQPASSAHTRDALGWQPTHAGLLEDLENFSPE